MSDCFIPWIRLMNWKWKSRPSQMMTDNNLEKRKKYIRTTTTSGSKANQLDEQRKRKWQNKNSLVIVKIVEDRSAIRHHRNGIADWICDRESIQQTKQIQIMPNFGHKCQSNRSKNEQVRSGEMNSLCTKRREEAQLRIAIERESVNGARLCNTTTWSSEKTMAKSKRAISL